MNTSAEINLNSATAYGRASIRRQLRIKIIICLLMMVYQSLQAQSRIEPFTTMSLSLSYTINVNHNQFHDYWRPGQGVNLAIQTPFHWGVVQAGLQYVPHRSHTITPSFDSYYLFLGWGFPFQLLRRIHWLNALQAGNYYMVFDDSQINVTQRHESELGMALYSVLSWRIYKQFHSYGAVRYLKVFTYKHLELTYLSFGVAYVLKTPGWLIRVLK